MTIPLPVFSILVLVALVITMAAPVLLLVLLVRDWKRKQLW
jgi:multisubunit Na+/H+ antiporter MnhC subunit